MTSSTSSFLSLFRSDITFSYSPVESLQDVSDEVGLPMSSLVKLDANENVYGAPQEVFLALSSSFFQESLHIYPDPTQRRLRQALASLHGVTPAHIVAGAGSDDIIDLLIRLLSPSSSSVIISTPTFGMYSFLSKISGIGNFTDVPRNSTFDVNIDCILAAIRVSKSSTTSIVFLPSPNNPTGNLLSRSDIHRLCSEPNTVIVIDEAYADFVDVTSPSSSSSSSTAIELLPYYPNLVVLRTFSKWAGLAGLRVGYGICTPALAEKMMTIKQPYNINVAAETAALAALDHRDQIMKSVRALREERERMRSLLEKNFSSWLRVIPSQANFLLIEVIPPFEASKVRLALRYQGIIVRYFGKQGGALENFIRISAGKPDQTDKVIEALKKIEETKGEGKVESFLSKGVVEGERKWDAIIFDMDGVIVDVSLSYRRAIIETGEKFGVTLTSSDISELKLAGSANNDWEVTHRLIVNKKKGDDKVPSLEEVTKAFEDIYQGTETTPGLWKTEALLIPPSHFERLSKAGYRLGIVTGRPRHPDAERFLIDNKIAHFFQTTVCMGEASDPKPHPAPVLLAMNKLGAKTGMMIGDTVDDVRAALGAGLTAFGVVAPGTSDPVREKEHLLTSGATKVVSIGLKELIEELCI